MSFFLKNLKLDYLNGLVGWWKLNEGIGGVTIDYSTKSNHGGLKNGPTWTKGNKGTCLYFNGSNQYVQLNTFQALTEFSISVWVKINVSKLYNLIFSSSASAGGNGIDLRIQSDFVRIYSGGSSILTTETYTPSNDWFHICVTRNNSNSGNIYINGVLKKTGSLNQPNASYFGSALIAAYDTTNGVSTQFNGLIRELRIYNRELQPIEINHIMNI